MSDIKVGIKLTTDGSGKVTAEITQVKKSLEDTGKAAETAAGKNKKAATDTKNAWNGVNDQINAAKKAFLAYVSVQAAWNAAKQITATADAWTNLNSRLRIVTGTQREFGTALADVSAIANRYQADINSVGAAYNRLAPIAANMGKSQQDLRASLESVSAALKLSGASTSEASETLRQFGQALSGPTVQMEEMNTIIDSASVLWQGLQRQFPDLIRQYGSLKEAVGKGALSNRELLEATIRLREEFDAQAQTMSVTVSGAMQVLSNEWAKYIGATDQARGSSNELAQAILSIAKNLDTIIQPFAWFVKTSVEGWAKIIDLVNQYRIALGNVALLKEQMAKDGDFNQAITPEEWNARRNTNGFATDRPRADGGFGGMDTGTARFDGINRSAQGAADSVGRLNQRVEEFSRRGAQASRNEINAYLESTTRGAEAAAQRLMQMGTVQKKVHDEAMRQGLNPAFALAIAQRESQFRQNLTSPAGAHGVMQLMPGTARRFGVDINDIDENIRGGVTYLKKLMEMFHGDMRLAAAAYNAGEHRKSFQGPSPNVPPFAETQKYVGYVRRNYERWSGQLGTGGGFSDFYNDAQNKAFDSAVSRINQRMSEADAARKAELEKIKQDLLQAEQLATQAEKNAEISIKMAVDPASQEKALKDIADAQQQRDAVIQKSISISTGVQDAKDRLKAIEDELKAAQKYAQEEGKIAKLQSQRTQAIAELKGAETAAQTEALKMEKERKDAQEKSAAQRLTAQKDFATLNVEQQRQIMEGLQAEFDLKQKGAEYSQAVMQQYYDDQRAAIDAGLIQAQNQVTLTEAERDRALQSDDILRIGESILANQQAQQALIEQTRQAELDKLNLAAEQLNYERQIADWKLQQTAAIDPNNQQAITAARQAVLDIEAQITANAQKQLDVMNQMPKQPQGGAGPAMDASGVTKVADELLRLNKIWDNAIEAVQEYSKTFVEAFGKSGEAVAKVADIMATYERRQKRIASEAKEAVTKDPSKALEINQRKYAQSIANTSDLMANLALTARGWMKEGSDGYKAMTIAAQSFAAISQAINLALGIQAVLKQLVDGDSYSALFRAIAVAAFVGSLGIAVAGMAGGSGGGGQTRKSAEDKQKEQFTGTVLGDMTAHSESLANSLSIVAENSTADLDYSKGMLRALTNIEKLLGGAAASVAGGLMNMPNLFQLGKGWKFSDIGLSSVDKTLGQYFSGGGFQGAAWGEIVKEAADGTKRYKDVYTELNGTVKGQFTRVIIGIADAVRKAGEAFGLNASDFNKKMMDFVVSFGNVSFGDLKGDDLTKAVQEMFSNMSDQMAMAFMPGLNAFQQVGEGYFETMVRVANGINVSTGLLAQAGLKAINYQDIVLKQGDVAAEIVRQSIVAYEGVNSVIGGYVDQAVGSAEELLAVYADLKTIRATAAVVGLSFKDLSNDMIVAAGGVSALKEALAYYLDNFFGPGEQAAVAAREFGDALRALGIKTLPTTKDQFRALMASIDQTSASGQTLYAQLLKLAPAFIKAQEAAKALADLYAKLKGGNPFADMDQQWQQLQDDWKSVIEGMQAQVRAPFDAKIQSQKDAIQGYAQAISAATSSIGLMTSELVRLSMAKAPASVLKNLEQGIATLVKNISVWQQKITEANQEIKRLEGESDSAWAARQQQLLREQGWSLINNLLEMWTKLMSGIKSMQASLQDQIDQLSADPIAATLATAYDRLVQSVQDLQNYRQGQRAAGLDTDPTVELGYLQQIQAAIMARYNAELAQIQQAQAAYIAAETERLNAALDATIEAINAELDARIQAINDALDADIAARQAETDAAIEALQTLHDAQVKALQQSFDAIIKARQKADEAVIKGMQKALEERVKLQQKADEAVIKSVQKRFDAENKALQKQFDAIIKARQKEYDAANKLTQRQFDAERKALQKTQDAKMQALTDELNAIKAISDYAKGMTLGANSPLSPEDKLREAQRQYQDLLSKSKAGDATAMGQLTGAADAYLQAARDYYGSSSQYQDIFSAMQDALTQIGGLSSTDPDSIQARIDALKDAQEAEMQALQDKQDEIMDTIREQQQDAIDALRETQQDQLDAIREAQQEQVDAIREAQQDNIDAIREAAQDQIDAVREAQQAQIDAIREAQQAQIDALRKAQQKQIDALREAGQKQIEALRKAAQDQIDAARKIAEKQIEVERKITQQKIADLSDPDKNRAIKALKERTVAELKLVREQADKLAKQAALKAEKWRTDVVDWLNKNQDLMNGADAEALRRTLDAIGQTLNGYQPPAFAQGGYAQAGMALVGEQGPELVRFERPAQVMTASETRSVLFGGGDTETRDILRDIKTEAKASVTVQSATSLALLDRLDRLDDRLTRMEKNQRRAADVAPTLRARVT